MKEIKEAIFQLIQTNTKTIKQIIEDGQKSKIFNTEIDGEYLVHFVMGSFRLQMLKWKLSNFIFDIEKQGINTMINLLKLLKK